ncbi:MAG: DUF2341 domain-containing protein, partial [Planctomycetota bacterium]|nr:DUF2341 domain-containing protein [Planctomycetota bacterium]
NIKPDGSDIRFILPQGADREGQLVAEVPYWIEGFNNVATSTIWVKVPTLPTGDTCIYMYYGNISATASSNGDNTFIFFDDFNGTQIDKTKWSIHPEIIGTFPDVRRFPVNLSNGYAYFFTTPEIQPGSSATVTTVQEFYEGNIIEVKVEDFKTGIRSYGNFLTGNSTYPTMWINDTRKWRLYNSTPQFIDNLGTREPTNGNYIFKCFTTETSSKMEVSGDFRDTAEISGNFSLSKSRFHIQAAFGASMKIDWFRLRKYANPEPIVIVSDNEQRVANYILLSNPTDLMSNTAWVKKGHLVPFIRFDLQLRNDANREKTTAFWKRLRIDKINPTHAPSVPDEQVEIQIWTEPMDTSDLPFFSRKERGYCISKGTFSQNVCRLEMNGYEITTKPQTFYIVCILSPDIKPQISQIKSGVQFGLEITNNSYLEFEETIVSNQNF